MPFESLGVLIVGFTLLIGIPVGVFLHRKETKRQVRAWASHSNHRILELDLPWFPLQTPFERSIYDGWVGVARVRVINSEGRELEGHVQINRLFYRNREQVITNVAPNLAIPADRDPRERGSRPLNSNC